MMLTTVERAKKQIGYLGYDDDELEYMIKVTSDAIETYCRRDFSKDYTLPAEEEEATKEKPRLPYDIEDACLLWMTYRERMNSSIGVSSERVDGVGQKNYALQHIDGKLIPAPPAVLALLDPYRKMIYS